MGRKISLLLCCLAACFLVSPWPTLSAGPEGDSCVKCHTDEGTMKSLFKVPAQGPSEGEG